MEFVVQSHEWPGVFSIYSGPEVLIWVFCLTSRNAVIWKHPKKVIIKAGYNFISIYITH